MWSGTTFTPVSGKLVGGHQKLDRIARAHLGELIDERPLFPKAKQILRFEGYRGPDSIKVKSPAKEEPWHYYSPFDDDDGEIIELIRSHYKLLVKALKSENQERSAFEAAWLAHAIVDGLTPAHHYPYEEKVEELWDGDKASRDTKLKKFIPPGETNRERVQKTWKYLGPRGLILPHWLFELGIAFTLRPLSLSEAKPKPEQIEEALELGAIELFRRAAREIAVLDMYDRYLKKGWTTKLVYDTRHKLCPTITRTITLAWYLALHDAKLVK
jgi:hypothetical protein